MVTLKNRHKMLSGSRLDFRGLGVQMVAPEGTIADPAAPKMGSARVGLKFSALRL